MPILNSEVQRETYIESGSDSWGDSNKYRRYHNVWKWLNTVRVYYDNHTHDAYYFAALKYAIPVGENRVIIYFHSFILQDRNLAQKTKTGNVYNNYINFSIYVLNGYS